MGRPVDEEHVLEALWGVRTCGSCGATIVLGQYVTHAVIGSQWKTLCSVCSSEPASSLRFERKRRRKLGRAA